MSQFYPPLPLVLPTPPTPMGGFGVPYAQAGPGYPPFVPRRSVVSDNFSRQPMMIPATSAGMPARANTLASPVTLPPEPSVGVAPLNVFQKLGIALHPKRTAHWLKRLRGGDDPATLRERLAMMMTVYGKLDKIGRVQLESLLARGILTDTNGDDRHSTLYYLYGVATTPRAKGLSCKNTLRELVATLDNPYRISQQFDRLKGNIAREMLASAQQSTRIDPRNPVSMKNFAEFSNTCSASGIMFILAQQQPKELARMAYGLTSPRLASREKVRLEQLADTPMAAIQKLQQYGIPYKFSGPQEVTVALRLPELAYERMVNDAQQPGKRDGVGAALQSAFINLVSRGTYDGLSDKSWDADSAVVAVENAESVPPMVKEQLKGIINSGLPMQTVQRQVLSLVKQLPMVTPDDRQMVIDGVFSEASGINEEQISMARSILQDKGSVDSVTYMVANANPDPRSSDPTPYLYGYTRSFDQMAGDLVTALKAGHYPIIGTVPTSASGAIENGHITTLTGAFVDQSGDLQFVIADSDDNIDRHVIRSARELIPELHHVSLPKAQSEQIKREMAMLGNNYFTPGASEAQRYQVISMVRASMP